MSFFPLDRDILTSSMWAESPAVLKVWLYMLLSANQQGVVRDTEPALALRCAMNREELREVLKILEDPDENSRSQRKDGRRIERCPDGFRIINYVARRSKDYSTPRWKRWKERQKPTVDRLPTALDRLPTALQTTNTNTNTNTNTPTTTTTTEPEPEVLVMVPDDLTNLHLYAGDHKLIARWSDLRQSWTAAFPRGWEWIMSEVRKAHAWECANPERAKKQRARFLTGWLTRAQDKPTTGQDHSAPAPPTGKVRAGNGQMIDRTIADKYPGLLAPADEIRFNTALAMYRADLAKGSTA